MSFSISAAITTIDAYRTSGNEATQPPSDEVGKALLNLGKAKRKESKRAEHFARTRGAEVFEKLIKNDTPRARMLAREMIRRDLLPSTWSLEKLALEAGAHPEMQTYVGTLGDRLNKTAEALTGEEILQLESNQFTKRILKGEQKEKWQAIQTEPQIRAKAKEAAKTSKEQAKAQEYKKLAQASQGYEKALQERIRLARAAGSLDADVAARLLDTISSSASSGGVISSEPSASVESDSPGVSPEPRTRITVRQSGSVPLGTIADPEHHVDVPDAEHPPVPMSAALGKRRIDAPETERIEDTAASSTGVAPHIQPWRTGDIPVEMRDYPDASSLPRTVDASYKVAGRHFHFLGPRKNTSITESARFDAAANAFVALVNMPGAPNQAPVFKNVPDLVHRIFADEQRNDPNTPVEIALEAIREGLRGSGRTLTPTAQKFLVWMARISDPSCLRLDDPRQVKMQQVNGEFQVQDTAVDGSLHWRPAGDGTLDVEYTKSVIAHWFDNAQDVRFDDGILRKDGALQNIRVSGPLYRENAGKIEFTPGLHVSMGKHRLNSLSTASYLTPEGLGGIREAAQSKRQQKPLRLHIDLDHLPEKPVNLGNLTEIAWGDMHGNTAMELYALHATGMIRIEQHGGKTAVQAWQEIRTAIGNADCSALDGLLEHHVKAGPNIAGRTFILLGDTLADRVGNDLVELQIRHHLREKLRVDLPEIYSNHNSYFDLYWLANQDKLADEKYVIPWSSQGADDAERDNLAGSLATQEGEPDAAGKGKSEKKAKDDQASLKALNRLVNHENLDVRSAARKRLRDYLPSYYQHMELRRIADDGRTVYSHGRSNKAIADALEAQARAEGVKIPSAASATEKTALINRWFRDKLCVLRNEATSAGKQPRTLLKAEEAYSKYTDLIPFGTADSQAMAQRPIYAQIWNGDPSGKYFFSGGDVATVNNSFVKTIALERGTDRNVCGHFTSSAPALGAYRALRVAQASLVKALFEPLEAAASTVPAFAKLQQFMRESEHPDQQLSPVPDAGFVGPADSAKPTPLTVAERLQLGPRYRLAMRERALRQQIAADALSKPLALFSFQSPTRDLKTQFTAIVANEFRALSETDKFVLERRKKLTKEQSDEEIAKALLEMSGEELKKFLPGRPLLANFKASFLTEMGALQEALKTWDDAYAYKGFDKQKLVDGYFNRDGRGNEVEAPGAHRELAALLKKDTVDYDDIVKTLFSGPVYNLFAEMDVEFAYMATHAPRDFAETRISLDYNSGSNDTPNFHRAYMGV
ncbi:MAG TPA: hypothetical protein VM512_08285 [Burkholderiaceae bacterium]|nr:hypothetical protein [Burkholderiaceae bacterium]